jgi:uncharacterized protein YggL (DUF469 family)
MFGFIVTLTLIQGVSESESDALTDDLIETLDASGLMMGGGGGGGDGSLELAISREGDQATHADRQVVAAWGTRWAHIARVEVSDLIDLNEIE